MDERNHGGRPILAPVAGVVLVHAPISRSAVPARRRCAPPSLPDWCLRAALFRTHCRKRRIDQRVRRADAERLSPAVEQCRIARHASEEWRAGCSRFMQAPRMKRILLFPKNPERTCWGCDKYCPADDLACGSGTIRTLHPVELFGTGWPEFFDRRALRTKDPNNAGA